jgi:hypothetical protein
MQISTQSLPIFAFWRHKLTGFSKIKMCPLEILTHAHPELSTSYLSRHDEVGSVVHACNSSTQESEAGMS